MSASARSSFSAPPVSEVRTRILDAAEAAVRAGGVATMTLDAVARQAGVSKGGLLYHFGSKELLLQGLMARLAGAVSGDFDALVAAQTPGAGRVARAMLAWIFDQPEAATEQHARMAAVLLACFHHDPALLAPVRAVFARMRAAVAGDGLPAGNGMAIMAAGDGLFLASVFGLYAVLPAEVPALRAALARLAEPAA